MKDTDFILRLFRLYRAYLLADGFVKEVLAEQISDVVSRNQMDYENIPDEIRVRVANIFRIYGSIHKAPSPSIRLDLEEKLAAELEGLNEVMSITNND